MSVRRYESPLRAEQAEATRQRILRAIVDLLADEDVDELSIPLVAQRAGVSLRTVYRHFPTREALFEAWGEWVREHLEPLEIRYPDNLDELIEFAPGLYQAYDANERLLRALLLSKAGRKLRARARQPRLEAVERALHEVTEGLDADEKRRALAVVYLLVSAPAWQAMRLHWGLDGVEAGKAAGWAVRVLTDELRRNKEKED